ncbi:DUF1648 domain-containing protein [Demequina sp. B12]|uniref:DUF1648 domain-containing protein n=1 Tax=Demequina sp. B12 TaxID=2992757 RepID=UPI00237C2155|nr:DUF1648 domain-containing protein [Demequina sp. B12]MDE0573325.1 DUF1648 domain-containing protein [Demequina sp. B12]
MNTPARPRLAPQLGPLTTTAATVSITATAVGVILGLAFFDQVPSRITIHWNAAGQADGWGPSWMLLVLLGTWALLTTGLLLLARRPDWFNYPTAVTTGNAQRVYNAGTRLMVWSSLWVSMIMGAATASAFGIDAATLIALGLIGLVGTTIAGVVDTYRASKPTRLNP